MVAVPTFLLPLEPITSLDSYLAAGGRAGVEAAQRIGPAATIETVTHSGLRGRGGGGFPTGRKWSGIAAQTGTRRYVVCNGAEGEPGEEAPDGDHEPQHELAGDEHDASGDDGEDAQDDVSHTSNVGLADRHVA